MANSLEYSAEVKEKEDVQRTRVHREVEFIFKL